MSARLHLTLIPSNDAAWSSSSNVTTLGQVWGQTSALPTVPSNSATSPQYHGGDTLRRSERPPQTLAARSSGADRNDLRPQEPGMLDNMSQLIGANPD